MPAADVDVALDDIVIGDKLPGLEIEGKAFPRRNRGRHAPWRRHFGTQENPARQADHSQDVPEWIAHCLRFLCSQNFPRRIIHARGVQAVVKQAEAVAA